MTRRLFTLALLAALTLTLSACQGHTPDKEAAAPTGDAAHSAQAEEPASAPTTSPDEVMPNDGTRQVGDVTRCPVSGDVFTVTAESPKAEHEGGTYYMCCGGCVDKFKADPEGFLAKAAGGHEAKAEPAGEALPNDGTRTIGDTTTCPVSGNTFTIAEDSPKVEHEGKTYFMCCGGCVDKFKAEPGKFLSKAE